MIPTLIFLFVFITLSNALNEVEDKYDPNVKTTAPAPILIQTTSGQVQGFVENGVRKFFGIPYATTQKRFDLPKPKTWSGIFNASDFGPVCYQQTDSFFPPLQMSEDCLFLHIYAPLEITEYVPVMFWIHGGAFLTGAGALYNGTGLALKNMIVVTINYRLGAFGFFQSLEIQNENPDAPTLGGMNGLLDQVFALKWINMNIAAFGGNSEEITIFGESAGGLSVCILAASSMSYGLFKNIIIESGACTGPWGPGNSTIGFAHAHDLMATLGVTTLEQMRAITPAVLLNASTYTELQPAVDNYFLYQIPALIYASGDVYIPPNGAVMIGTNTIDTLFGFPWYNGPFPTDNSTFIAYLAQFFGINDAQRIFSVYPATPTPKIAYQRINAHLCLTCPTRNLVQQLSAYYRVYQYEFGWNSATPHWAGHFAECPHVFGTIVPPWPFNQTLSDIMMNFWTSFSAINTPVDPRASWPYYSTDRTSIYLDDYISLRSNAYAAECDFWDQYASSSPENFLKTFEFCYQVKLT
jgi:para-nitrobenzyl esterase